jgi:hypothetical protein
LFGDMSEPLLIRVHCKSIAEDAALFEGRVKQKKSPSPRGVFDLTVREIQTPMGLPLELEVFYDASINAGNLAVATAGERLLWTAPLTRQSCIILLLPTQEELTITTF